MAALSQAEIQQRLRGVPDWRLQDEGTAIACERTLADFAAAIGFVDRVAELAEAANHHPDILIHGYRRVRLVLCTHSQGGLTDADFQLAGQIDRVA